MRKHFDAQFFHVNNYLDDTIRNINLLVTLFIDHFGCYVSMYIYINKRKSFVYSMSFLKNRARIVTKN